MIRTGAWVLLWIGLTVSQSPPVRNPVQNDLQGIEEGARLFRSKCAVCHGVNALGYRGPDLTTGRWKHGGADAQVFSAIRRGIPGTDMPGAALTDNETWMIVNYLRALSGPARVDHGDARNGQTLFWGKGGCSKCHRVSGRGGRLGPDLTFIAAARSRAALVREIRQASEIVPRGYETVTIVTRNGQRIAGLRKNEDAFSIQIMDTSEQIRTLMRNDVQEIISAPNSLMPDYGPDKLTDTELDDLLRYLVTVSTTK